MNDHADSGGSRNAAQARNLSRRRFLLGATGSAVAVGATLGSSNAWASTRTSAYPSRFRLAEICKGRVGATVQPQGGNTRAQQAVNFARILGNGNPSTYPLSTSIQKIYFQPGHFPTKIPDSVSDLQSLGCKVVLCYKPAFNPPTPSDRTALHSSLAAMREAQVCAQVVLWHEPQNIQNNLSAAQFKEMIKYYGPTVRKSNYKLVYNASFSQGMKAQREYYPGDAAVDIIACDFYANKYIFQGFRLDTIESIANNAARPKPFGIYEFGVTDCATQIPSRQQVTTFIHYLRDKMATRVTNGKRNAAVVWYDGGGLDAIRPGSYKIPLLQDMWTALSNTA